MLTVKELTHEFDGQTLFKDVNLNFVAGNCYGIIGANGAGKSTLLKFLSGQREPTKGEVFLDKNARMSVLDQDHFKYDEFYVMETVIMGNPRLYEIMKEKDELYAKADFSEADGERAADLEGEFAELDGWEAETEVLQLLNGLGVSKEFHYSQMKSLNGRDKVKVLLAKALFGKPSIILLDEPTNHLDIDAIEWLEEFIIDFMGTVLVVSHDRHFLNTVCTYTVDIDYNKVKMYAGNYDFWYESSQLMSQLLKNQNKKKEEKIKQLEEFIRRFSANKSKSKQATSRKKTLDNIQIEDMPASSRKYPFVGFVQDREVGKDVLEVKNLSKTVDGVKVLNDVSFYINRLDKIALVGDNEAGQTALFKILNGEMEPDEGFIKWGVSTTKSYFPKDNNAFFDNNDENLVEWLRKYSKDQTESFLRGFLGRMLFSGDDVYKKVNVLSGGEKVRCMLSRMMMQEANVIMLDQPTNHLDLESITAVNNGISDFKGTVVFSSHDHQFIETIANRIIEIKEDGSIVDKQMTYEEYIEEKHKK
ncbi:MAG: ABC-F family ATP-binding cassette domain-containing protein [Oscillospiraceae bacterium]